MKAEFLQNFKVGDVPPPKEVVKPFAKEAESCCAGADGAVSQGRRALQDTLRMEGFV